jgi:subtilisin family serine protease
MTKPHLLLNNPRGEQRKFDASRGFTEEPERSSPPPSAYRPQKDKLNTSLTRFTSQRQLRSRSRTIEIPTHIDYVRIDFFDVFYNHPVFKTKASFRNNFGLVPVAYANFNQTVYFVIVDESKFATLLTLLQAFINSRDNIAPGGTPYAITTLIYDFEFLSTDQILQNRPEDNVILSLVSTDDSIADSFETIFNRLIDHVRSLSTEERPIEIFTDRLSTIEISNITRDEVKILADNFDIIYKIQSLRIPVIRPNRFNLPHLTWNIELSPPRKNVVIGVLDNGVRAIDPLRRILINYNLDITNKLQPNPLQASHPHGTVVASLAALGISFFDTNRSDFISSAYILPIKILNLTEGQFKIYDIISAIQTAVRKGVRIFNLSVTGPSKIYNETVTEYAYLLDRLSYENDILIFIAAGNLDEETIEAMQEDVNAGLHRDFHIYPLHFYNPGKLSDYHSCEAINLAMPGESFNNITVGAIADNKIPDPPSGLTPLKELPAYYTRKHYIDYTKKINGTEFRRSQMNYNINKPDIVMPGGDRLGRMPGMQVIGFGEQGNDFYNKDSGTSLATPLAANLASRIVGLYPSLNMQSVKALIINSATKLLSSEFLDDLVAEVRETYSRDKFGKAYSQLNTTERKGLNEKINSDDLYHRLVGYGLPDEGKALYSDSKSVSIVIQDTIALKSYKVINLNIPKYLLDYSKNGPLLHLKATLCYKFPPVWNNHLGYNPLHVSFNFIKSVKRNDPVSTAAIIADKDHQFFNPFTRGLTDPKEISKAKNEALGVKKTIQSWSEDFYPPVTKPFSNTQQLELNVNKAEIEKVNRQISVVVRCTYKTDIDPDLLKRLQGSAHEFSIAINIAERSNTELAEFDLYDELVGINSLDNLAEIDLESEGEGELEAE